MRDFDAKLFLNKFTGYIDTYPNKRDVDQVRIDILEAAKRLAASYLHNTGITSSDINVIRSAIDLLGAYNDQLISRKISRIVHQLLNASNIRQDKLDHGEEYYGVLSDAYKYFFKNGYVVVFYSDEYMFWSDDFDFGRNVLPQHWRREVCALRTDIPILTERGISAKCGADSFEFMISHNKLKIIPHVRDLATIIIDQVI